MKVLVTGASGLLGREIMKDLGRRGFDATGTAHSRCCGELVKIDLLDRSATGELIRELTPGLIIHAAAERRPDVVKSDAASAEKLNVSAVATVAESAAEIGATLLFISTDYVFDGTAPPYSPSDSPNPLNAYGRMKLEGEVITLTRCLESIILRVPILYGNVESLAESAVTTIAESIRCDKPSFHDDEAIRYPTHTEDVAHVIGELAEKVEKGEAPEGIFHWSSEAACTKYSLALMMAEMMGVDKHLIIPAEPNPNAAPRPLDAHLDTSRLAKMGIGSEKDLKSTIAAILKKFR